ncbi:MAG TPA: glycosyl transferase [Ktedonobacter sp.]|nr:glycosyl transferase [Ktedonobacter sp.]
MQYTDTTESSPIPQAPTTVVDIGEKVKSYTTWLAVDSRRNTLSSNQEGISKYIDDAMEPVMVGEQEVRPFAPFRRNLSALQTTTSRQRLILKVIGLVYALGLLFYSTVGLEIIIATVTLFYIGDLLFYFFLSMRVLEQSTQEQIDDEVVHALADADWPRYTILCPLYHEADVVPQFVWAMQAFDYPTDKLQILLLTEEEDFETHKAIQEIQLPHHFKMVTVPVGEPRTKPRACNYGLLQATGDYVTIYDAEDVPEPLQLKKAILTFANHGSDLACVQAKLNFYNTEQNLLTRWFTAEYSSWFDVILPGLQKLGVPLPLGGTSNHFRIDLLRKVGAWDVFNVTEDCDLGLRLGNHHLKTAMVDSTTYEEAASQVKNWLRQRSRWIKGYIQTYLVHMRHPLDYLRSRRLNEFLTLQLIIGGKPAILFVNPLMWMLLATYILFHTFVVNAYHTLYPMPILYMGTICLVFGNFTYMYIHLIGCMKRGRYNLVKWTLFMPIYWTMMSIAAYFALYQLVFKPHYWEKTLHGLHLRTSSSSSRITLRAVTAGTMEIEATRSSSNMKLMRDDFELEFTEKTFRLKVHTSGRHPAVSKNLVFPSKSRDSMAETVRIEEVVTKEEKPLSSTETADPPSNRLISEVEKREKLEHD